MPTPDYEPLVATDNERTLLKQIERALEERPRLTKLVSSNGEAFELPLPVLQGLRQLIARLEQGRTALVVALDEDLTTQEAADLLNVSRPYLVRLLEEGQIPFTKTGTHRRIRYSDLMEFKKRRDAERRKGLAELTQFSQDLGLYD